MAEVKVIVGNLAPSTTAEELCAAFCQVEEPTDWNVLRIPGTGVSRCVGYVKFASEEAANKAVEQMNKFKLG